MSAGKKTAIVLFNLGGPDNPAAVQPFLENLFSDPAIMRVPKLLRKFIARQISRKRTPIAQAIYAQLGGGSPILANTQAQAQALEHELAAYGAPKVFIMMRYWHPFAAETWAEIAAYAPDRIVLLPLYPQFSTTTTASSRKDFYDTMPPEIKAACVTVGCYPTDSGFIRAMAAGIKKLYPQALAYGQPRILFSAHGLPEKIIRGGDPYQWQCEQTAQAVARDLGIANLDWVNCYQSRVGPLQWITPATDEEIRRAGADGVPVIVVPIAFVSEHSETLVELDIEYRHLAQASRVPFYGRVPTVGTAPEFITGLGRLVRQAMLQEPGTVACGQGARICPAGFGGCGCG